MNRVVNGWLQSEDRLVGHRLLDDLAPFISGRVIAGDDQLDVDCLIDSGSDTTTLMPDDAYKLLGDRYLALPFSHDPSAIEIFGVGGSYRALPLEVTLRMHDEHDDPLSISQTIWIAEPDPGEPSLTGNWTFPSIFGRDAIRPGDFELSYSNNTVTLIRPSDE